MFRYAAPPVTFSPGGGSSTKKEITFSSATNYEIYNYYGKLQKRGFAKRVKIAGYKNGKYFLNYDNKTETFEKK